MIFGILVQRDNMGALFSGSIGLALYPLDAWFIFPLMILGGIIGVFDNDTCILKLNSIPMRS